MLLIETIVKPSRIHGLGCFTCVPIPKGETIWAYDRRLDLRIDETDVLQLPNSMQTFLNCYCYVELVDGKRQFVLCGDNSRHMNHSDNPNTAINMACRDIQAGEELTCDYTAFDLDAHAKIPGVPATLTTS